jgi:hypothetical protein
MNWSRFFLRLWIAVSALWVIVALGAFTVASVTIEMRPNPECENGKMGPVACKLFGLDSVPTKVWHAPAWEAFLIIAVVPPLLLGIGVTGRWVTRGLKNPN